MLDKYWNSSALALTIKPSRVRRVLCCLSVPILSWANWLVFESALPHLLLLTLPVTLVSLWNILLQPYCGASLGWRAGQWLFIHHHVFTTVELRPDWVCLPWMIRLRLREPESGNTYSLLLFHDSAEPEALLRLRRRLRLER